MKTALLFLFMSACLLLQANTIRVGPQQRVKSIRQALEMARPGDTINVEPGIYREGTLTLTKPVLLNGINYPVIDGENKVENLIISGRDITVSGFLIRDSKHSSSNDYAAVSVIDATRITISNNRIYNAHFAVHIANSTYCTVKNNQITGQAVSEQSAGNGIHIWKSDHAVIEKNRIRGHRDGIYFEFVTSSEIRNNISEYNIRYGLHFMFSHKDNYTSNIFRNNGTGVAVMYTHDVKMTGNIFENNWGPSAYGILLKDITDSQMEHNRFTGNTTGIFMEGGNRMLISNTVFRNNGWAMKIQANCTDNIITGNNFLQNTFDIATNGTAVMSVFDGNYWDKYDGYDINKDGTGDIPYRPVSMYSMLVEQNPGTIILLRSFMVSLLDRAEKAMPAITPENLADHKPAMKPYRL